MSRRADVVDMLRQFKLLYGSQGEGWKSRAYSKAIIRIRDFEGPLPKTASELLAIPNIGKGVASKIEEFFEKGYVTKLRQLQKDAPPKSISELTKIPGVGMKKAKVLFLQYRIKTLAGLIKKHDEGKIEEDWLNRGIETYKLRGDQERIPLYRAMQLMKEPLDKLKKLKWVKSVHPAGSIRRCKATVKDMDTIVVIDTNVEISVAVKRIVKKFNLPDSGDRKCYIPTGEGRFVDLYFCYPNTFGTMVLFLTGSGEWNAWLRSIVKKKGGKLNQYYLEMGGKKIRGLSEKSLIVKILGHYIPPECREKPGDSYHEEDLVKLSDIKGDFHLHTTKSDGLSKPTEMSRACKERGYTFCGFADHVGYMPWSARVGSYDKWVATFRRNQSKLPIKTLVGAEMDVSKYGKLSVPLGLAQKLDFLCISSHQNPGENLEERYLTAFKKLRAFKGLKILAHPINRNLTKGVMTEWNDINWSKIFYVAKQENIYLEINGVSDRLDLDWELARVANRLKCKFVLSSDSHHVNHLENIRLAVLFARKAGLSKNSILNATFS